MRRLLALLSCLVITASACGQESLATGPTPTGDRYEVLSTAYPLYEITARLGGDRFHASNLRPEGALSDAPLTEDERRQIIDADLLFVLGHGSQPVIEAALSDRTKPTVALPAAWAGQFVWLDPTRMGALLATVRNELVRFDPGGAKLFGRNAQRYGKGIARLDKTMSRDLAVCERREFVTTRPVYGPLADRFRLIQIDGSDPLKLQRAVEQHRPEVVFFDRLPPLDEAQRRERVDGYRSAVLDPIVNQDDQARRAGANYEVLMRLNVAAMVEALGCTDDSERQ